MSNFLESSGLKKKVKQGKICPKTSYEGPNGEKMYSSFLSSTSALDGGGSPAPLPGRFTPGN